MGGFDGTCVELEPFARHAESSAKRFLEAIFSAHRSVRCLACHPLGKKRCLATGPGEPPCAGGDARAPAACSLLHPLRSWRSPRPRTCSAHAPTGTQRVRQNARNDGTAACGNQQHSAAGTAKRRGKLAAQPASCTGDTVAAQCNASQRYTNPSASCTVHPALAPLRCPPTVQPALAQPKPAHRSLKDSASTT